MEVGWDTSNLAVLMKDGQICESCCIETIPSVCGFCVSTQPTRLYITLSDFVNCGCIYPPLSYYSYKYEGDLATQINNKTYTVNHKSGCIYELTTPIDVVTEKMFSGSGCSGAPAFTYYLYYLRITITAILTGVTIEIRLCSNLTCTGEQRYVFRGNISYASGEKCFDTDIVAINLWSGCYGDAGGGTVYICPVGGSGKASISLIE